ncbi:Enamelin [Penicillium digitatum]|uniref:Enamelin n=1 Tax=Penicillium digitatum TaxID=36651 RepID=A0A7T7BIV7_PENDI|nr:Enamelin [Penicillium digitatum]
MKGFIGGIPVALLAVAAQAKFAERQEHDFHPQAGGTAIGGPSGNDDDGFVSPYSASIQTETHVNQWNKDDHSIKLKHTDVYPAPPVLPVPFEHRRPQGPQEGPFEKRKRSAPGGTAIGGPSGDDEGQSFELSVTGVFDTEVHDENQDDHSIDLKEKNIYPAAPVVVHPPPHFGGPPRGGYRGPAGSPSAGFNAPSQGYEKRFGPHAGGTAIGGPSGNDGGQSFSLSTSIETSADVHEHNEDDHSIGLTHEDVYPYPHAHSFSPFRRSENHGPPGHGGAPPAGHFEPHPEPHYEPHTEAHYEPHNEPHYEPHPEPHFENHPEPHFENHPEPHYAPHYSPTYEPHYEPHTTFEHELTSLKNNNNGPSAGSIVFGRRGFPAGPGPHVEPHPEPHFEPHSETHFEPHPEPHFEPHSETHIEPHPEPHFEPHPEPHFENHPEPHFENHPEPHYAPNYSPIYEPHYEPHTKLESEITSLKDNNNGPSAGSIVFGRRGFPASPGPHVEPHPEPHFEPHSGTHFEPHPEPHFEPHSETHFEPHPEPHYAPHPEPHFESNPEPHFENHPEPHYDPHYSPSYTPHYEPHTTFDSEITSLKNNNNGPAAGSITFRRRAYAPTRDADIGGGTAIGGPSGDDDGSAFSAPTDVDVTNDVDEHNEDNHAITGDFTHVHPDGPAEYSGEDQVEGPQCAAQTQDVVHTVTKTQYKTAEATHVVYQSAPVVEANLIPGDAHDPEFVGADAYAPPAPARSSASPENPMYRAPTTNNLNPTHVPMAAPSSGSSAAYANYPKPSPGTNSFGDYAQPSTGAYPSADYAQPSTGANPSADYAQPSTGANPSADYAQPSTGANPFADYAQPSTGANPFADYAQPSTGANPFADYAQPSTGANPSADYARPSTGANPSADYAQPSTGANPFADYAQPSTGANPSADYAKPSTGADPFASYSQSSAGADPFTPQRPSYSQIPVHVPNATPVPSGGFSKAGPSSIGKINPTGVSPEQNIYPSSSASAFASHGIMFEGDAARLSGGIVSVVAAVIGVLAFII